MLRFLCVSLLCVQLSVCAVYSMPSHCTVLNRPGGIYNPSSSEFCVDKKAMDLILMKQQN